MDIELVACFIVTLKAPVVGFWLYANSTWYYTEDYVNALWLCIFILNWLGMHVVLFNAVENNFDIAEENSKWTSYVLFIATWFTSHGIGLTQNCVMCTYSVCHTHLHAFTSIHTPVFIRGAICNFLVFATN